MSYKRLNLGQGIPTEMEVLQIAVPLPRGDVVTVLAPLVHGDILINEEVHLGISGIDLGRSPFEQTKILDPVIGFILQGLLPRGSHRLRNHELQVFLQIAFQLLLNTVRSFRTT